MALSDGEIVQVNIRGTVLGQEFSVSQFYRCTDELPTYEAPNVGFDVWQHFKTAWRLWQGTYGAFFTNEVTAVSLTNPFGLGGSYSILPEERTGTGARSGDPAPSFVAAGITLRGANRLVRPGSRRIPFVYEADLINGDYASGAPAELLTLADRFDTEVASGELLVGLYLVPVLVGRTDEGLFDLTRVLDVLDATARPNVTSQVSRKRGRGS